MSTSRSRYVLTAAIVLVVSAIALLIYVFTGHVRHAGAESAAAIAKDVTRQLASLRFKRIDPFPHRGIVLLGNDAVGRVVSGGRFGIGADTNSSLLLLGVWINSDVATIARRSPDLAGRVAVTADSMSMVVHLVSQSRDSSRAVGYLILQPDARWIPIH